MSVDIICHKQATHFPAPVCCLTSAERLSCRYLNSVAAKALYRADDTRQGDTTAQRFTRDNTSGVSNLGEMQALWYELESGRAYLRQGILGMVRLHL